jgi:hypothetical protein
MLQTMLPDARVGAVTRRQQGAQPRAGWDNRGGGLSEHQYVAMADAYGPSGGIAGCDAMVGLLRSSFDQPISVLARWIVGRTVVSFEWRSTTLLPMFQFDLADMTIRPRVSDVLRELRDAFDDQALALWFTRPNAWLDGRTPVDVLRNDAASVLHTARADRYVACG